MARNKTKRLRPKVLKEIRDAYAALKAIRNYQPPNPDYALDKVTEVFDQIDTDQTLEVQADAAAEAQRDQTVKSEHGGLDIIQGVRTQVKAQFGEESDEYASLGMKKRSEYNRPKRRAVKPPEEPT